MYWKHLPFTICQKSLNLITDQTDYIEIDKYADKNYYFCPLLEVCACVMKLHNDVCVCFKRIHTLLFSKNMRPTFYFLVLNNLEHHRLYALMVVLLKLQVVLLVQCLICLHVLSLDFWPQILKWQHNAF